MTVPRRRYFDELCMPGLKVWDEESVRQREDFLRDRRSHAGAPRGRGGAGPREWEHYQRAP